MKISIGCPILNAGEDINTFFCDHLVSDPEVEYVIYENASTDGTREKIQEWQKKLGERVKVFYANRNDGCNIAANWILKNYTTPNMFWFNDDYIVHDKDFYEPYLKRQEENGPAIVTISCSKDSVNMVGADDGFYRYKKEYCTEIQGGYYPSNFRIFHIPKAVTDKVEWDPRFFYAYGDVDFIFKAVKLGFPLMIYLVNHHSVTRKPVYSPQEQKLYDEHYISDTNLFYSIWNKANIIL